MKTAGELDGSFEARRRPYLIRPTTDVGPEGLTDEQIAEIAEVMAEALWE